jgi:hypothetical protein
MSTGLFQDEEDGYNLEEETKYKLKLDAPTSEPAFGDSGGDDLGGLEDLGGEDDLSGLEDLGGEDDKPFDSEPFDAGVDAEEGTDPEKFIQQLSGKLGTSLRKYTEDKGQPDFDLEKFAINSVISATNTSDMDEEDRNDIIKKINTSGDEDLGDDLGGEEPIDDMGGDESTDDMGGSDELAGLDDLEEAAVRDLDAEKEANKPNLKVYTQDPNAEKYIKEFDDSGIEDLNEALSKLEITSGKVTTIKNMLNEMEEPIQITKPSSRRKRMFEVRPTKKRKVKEETSVKNIMFNGKEVDVTSIEVDGVSASDYPDFADAFISDAKYIDGQELTDDELDMFTEANYDLTYDLAYNSFF